MSLKGEPIVIVGAIRSGASCLATVLSELGAFLGDKADFYQANENHIGGSWTIREFQDLNLQGYALLGMNYYQVNRTPVKWDDIPNSGQFTDAARNFLRRQFDDRTEWGWNEPTATGILPLVKRILAEEKTPGRYAICVRHPLATAASQISRTTNYTLGKNANALKDLAPPVGENTVGLWLHYTLSALKETQGASRLVVSFEDFVQHPKSTVENIARYLLTWKPTDSQFQKGIASVKPELNHHKYTLEDLDEWPSIVRRTYELSLRGYRDPDGFNGGKFDEEVDSLWDEHGQMAQMIQPIALPAGQVLFSWRDGTQAGHHGLKYSPTGDWQTLRSVVPAPPGAVIQIDPYQTPCQIWIKKAVWIMDGEEKPAPLNPGPNGVMTRVLQGNAQENLGLLRLTIFGPGPLLTRAPAKSGKAEFEIEFMLQSNPVVLAQMLGMIRGRLEEARRGA